MARGEESGGGTDEDTESARPSAMYRLGGQDDPGWRLAPAYGKVAAASGSGAAASGSGATASGSGVPEAASGAGVPAPARQPDSTQLPAAQPPEAAESPDGGEGTLVAAGAAGHADAPPAAAPDADATAAPAPGRSLRPRWRAGVRRLGGLLAPRDDADRLLTVRTTPLSGCHRIAVIGLRAGSGRTTTAAVLGSLLAAERSDRVIAVDADPASGTLGHRIAREAGATGATVRDLVTALPRLDSYTDIRAYTSRTPDGLEVLADDPGAAASRPFDDREYRGVMELLSRRYPIVVTDTGAGLSNGRLPGVLELADQLVLVVTASVAGVTGASTALTWLEEHGFQERARRCVTVISGVREPGRVLRADELVAHFETRCRGVVAVPYDEHLAAAGELTPGALRRRTRAAHLELAALVAEGFTVPE
ncbi:MinD/ParA family protein [Streptomyces sp. NPDC060048]|uniref:MinD/ParA family ATP-binding protein n=1 Tax=unclassified Streptomyces TaxID=2593676 RepID=UPI003692CAB3